MIIGHRRKVSVCEQPSIGSGNVPDRKRRSMIGTEIAWTESFPASSGFLIKKAEPQFMQKKEIVARFREKENADKFAEKANRRTFETVTVEQQNGLWEVRLVPVRKIPKFEPPKT